MTIVDGRADLKMVESAGAEMIEFEEPGIGVSAGLIRAIEPAEVFGSRGCRSGR